MPVRAKGGYVYIETATGKMMPWGPFGHAKEFRDGMARVQAGSERKFGYVSESGELVIPCQYASATEFANGFAIAGFEESKLGLIDKKGKWVVEPTFEGLHRSNGYDTVADGLFVAQRDGKWGYINERGGVVIPFQYERAMAFSEGLASVAPSDRAKWGYIDREGKIRIEPQFNMALGFIDGRAMVARGDFGGWGFIDSTGKTVVPFKHDSVLTFDYSGRAFVTKDGRSYMIDRDGARVGTKDFAQASSFSGGLAAVREIKDGPMGFINPQGEYVIKPAFDEASRFDSGVSKVKVGATQGLIDRHGAWIWKSN